MINYAEIKNLSIDEIITKIIILEDKLNIASKIKGYDIQLYSNLQEMYNMYTLELDNRIDINNLDETEISEKYSILEKKYFENKKNGK